MASKGPKMLHFPSTENQAGSLSLVTNRGTGSWLGPTVRVKGDISGNGDLLICGSVEGTIKIEERQLTIGRLAKIDADISAGEVVTHGLVKGDVHTTRRIEIRKGGSVMGNVTAAQITIENGAGFKGFVEIGPNSTKERTMREGLQHATAGAGRT